MSGHTSSFLVRQAPVAAGEIRHWRAPCPVAQGQLGSGAIRIPGTVGPLVVTADLRAGKVTCHVDVEAPREGKATTRVNRLVRQMKNAPDTARVEVFVAHARGSSAAELLSTVRENPASLVVDSSKDIRTFRVAATGNLGSKRGRGRGAFIDSVLGSVDSFYGDVLGSLRTWAAAPPKLRPVHAEPPEVDDSVATALVSTDYSSQDGMQEDAQERELDADQGRIVVAVTTTAGLDRAAGANPEAEATGHDSEAGTDVTATMSPTGSD